jgi:hypothetical protein
MEMCTQNQILRFQNAFFVALRTLRFVLIYYIDMLYWVKGKKSEAILVTGLEGP